MRRLIEEIVDKICLFLTYLPIRLIFVLLCASILFDKYLLRRLGVGGQPAGYGTEMAWNMTTIYINQTYDVRMAICRLQYSSGRFCTSADSGRAAIFNQGTSTRWYYSSTLGTCQAFQYLGCGGNPNNFPDQNYCAKFCDPGEGMFASACPYGGAPYVTPSGAQPQCGIGSGYICPAQQYQCVPVTQGLITKSLCCPTRSNICSLPFAEGSRCVMQKPMMRWYYNLASDACQNFTWNGCNGNDNNFANQRQCYDVCQSGRNCLLGEEALVGSTGGRPVRVCTQTGTTTGCPAGYTCRGDSTVFPYRGTCCGSAQESVCPNNTVAFIDPYVNDIKTCQPNAPGTCGNGYICVINQNMYSGETGYYCCRGIKNQCPTGQSLYVDPFTSAPRTCPLYYYSTCPMGYTCTAFIPGAFEGYCCTNPTAVTVKSQCPTGTTAYLDQVTNLPVACTVGVGLCPVPGYVCQSSVAPYTGSVSGFCCSIPGMCPAGYTLQTTKTGLNQSLPTYCNYATPNACGPGAICNVPTDVFTQTGFCCQIPVATTACAAGQRPFLDPKSGAPVACDFVSKPCTAGFACQFSYPLGTYYCCALNVGCPGNNSAPQIDPTTGAVLGCGAGSSTCASGFSCVATNSSGSVCCSTPPSATTAAATTAATTVVVATTGSTGGTTAKPATAATASSNTSATPSGSTASTKAPNTTAATAPAQPPILAGQVCPGGSTPSFYPGTMIPQQCGGSFASICPLGYTCISTGILTAGYCCPSQAPIGALSFLAGNQPFSSEYCPAGSFPWIFPGSAVASPYSCYPSGQVCPSGYDCSPAPTLPGQFFCCGRQQSRDQAAPAARQSAQFCPQGQPQAVGSTGSPQSCYPGSSVCSYGFACQLGPMGQYYCCPTGSAVISVVVQPVSTVSYCSNKNSVPYFYAGRNEPLQCYGPGYEYICPTGYACQLSPSYINAYFCCNATISVAPARVAPPAEPPTEKPPTAAPKVDPLAYCPNRVTPYYYPGTTDPLVCVPKAQLIMCPQGYSCQTSPWRENTFFCCADMTPASDCEQGTPLIWRSGRAWTCGASAVPGDGPCPLPSTCQYSAARAQYVCCMPTMVARQGQQAVTNATTLLPAPMIPTTVAPTTTQRPTTLSTPALKVTTPAVAYCPGSMETFYYPGTMTPLACDPKSMLNLCPVNFACQASLWKANSYFCCGGASFMIRDCPQGTPLIMRDGTPWQCAPGLTGPCPAPAVCQYSQARLQYICCAPGPPAPAAQSSVSAPAPMFVVKQEPPVTQIMTTPKPPVLTTLAPPPAVAAPAVSNTIVSSGVILATDDLRCPAILVGINPFCQQGDLNACPLGFSCEYVITRRAYHCCRMPVNYAPVVPQNAFIANVAPPGPAPPVAPTLPTLLTLPTPPPAPAATAPPKSALAGPQASLPGYYLTTCPTGQIQLKDESGKIACWPLLSPGDVGCRYQIQCNFPGSYCSGDFDSSKCVCPANLLLYARQCVTACPSGFMNVNGVCAQAAPAAAAQTANEKEGRFFASAAGQPLFAYPGAG